MFRKRSAGHSSPMSRARLLGRQTCDACSFFFPGKNIKTGSFEYYGEKTITSDNYNSGSLVSVHCYLKSTLKKYYLCVEISYLCLQNFCFERISEGKNRILWGLC